MRISFLYVSIAAALFFPQAFKKCHEEGLELRSSKLYSAVSVDNRNQINVLQSCRYVDYNDELIAPRNVGKDSKLHRIIWRVAEASDILISIYPPLFCIHS